MKHFCDFRPTQQVLVRMQNSQQSQVVRLQTAQGQQPSQMQVVRMQTPQKQGANSHAQVENSHHWGKIQNSLTGCCVLVYVITTQPLNAVWFCFHPWYLAGWVGGGKNLSCLS